MSEPLKTRRTIQVTYVVEMKEENHCDEHDFANVYADIIAEAGNKILAIVYGDCKYAAVHSEADDKWHGTD